MAAKRTPLTNDQTCVLLTAPDSVNDKQLTSALGATYSAVHNRRWHLRKRGWTCRVEFAVCLHCGETVTLRHRAQRWDQPYHESCRPEAMRAWDQQLREQMSPETRARKIGRHRELQDEYQESTVQTAVNRGQRWTESDLSRRGEQEAHCQVARFRTALRGLRKCEITRPPFAL